CILLSFIEGCFLGRFCWVIHGLLLSTNEWHSVIEFGCMFKNPKRVPFDVNVAGEQFTGEIVGDKLNDYSVYEVVLSDGTILPAEAIPASGKRYLWFTLSDKWQMAISMIG